MLLSADRPAALWRWANRACIAAGIPFSRCGYVGYCGLVGPLVVPGRTPCLNCFAAKETEQPVPECLEWINERAITPSVAPLNALLANVQAWEIARYCGKLGGVVTLGSTWSFDLVSLRSRLIARHRDVRCCICGNPDEGTT